MKTSKQSQKIKNYLVVILMLLSSTITVNAQGWGQTQKIVPDDREHLNNGGLNFGWSLAMDGNYAVIGTKFKAQAYIFENDGNGNWSQLQKLESPNFNQWDHFGTAVAISGDYIMVSSTGEDYDVSGNNFLDEAGAVYIFKKNANGTWDYTQKIVANVRRYQNQFGRDISISGNYAIIGVTRHDYDATGNNIMDDAGTAYIFEKDGTGIWNQVEKIVASDRNPFDYFGQQNVSISGNFAVVGSYGEDEDASGNNTIASAGSAYVFKRDGGGNWNEIQKIVASDRAQGEFFGWDTAIDGDYIIIGANQENQFRGASYIFKNNGSDVWNEMQKIVASNSNSGDRFGESVDIDGNKVIIGAYLKNYTIGTTTYPGGGAAYIFERDNVEIWTQIQYSYGLDRAASDYFGNAVAISNGFAFVGANQEDEDENGLNFIQEAGSVYIFDANEPNTIVLNTINNSIENQVVIYPNPATTILNIKSKTKINSVKIYNTLGQQVFFKENTSLNQQEDLLLDVSKLNQGLYILKIKDENNNFGIKKIIKE